MIFQYIGSRDNNKPVIQRHEQQHYNAGAKQNGIVPSQSSDGYQPRTPMQKFSQDGQLSQNNDKKQGVEPTSQNHDRRRPHPQRIHNQAPNGAVNPRPGTRPAHPQASAPYQSERAFQPIGNLGSQYQPGPASPDTSFQPISVLEKQNHRQPEDSVSSPQQGEFGNKYLSEGPGPSTSRNYRNGQNSAQNFNGGRNPSQSHNHYESASRLRNEENDYSMLQHHAGARPNGSAKPQKQAGPQDNSYRPRALSSHRNTTGEDDDDGGFKSRSRAASSSTVV